MTDDVLTVREVTERLRRTVEGCFPFVWVSGEITGLARPSSGHVYFALREGEALLPCVWFRGRQRTQETFDPLTGEVFEDGPRPNPILSLRDGRQCVCAGRLTVYAPRGGYQLLVDFVRESGEGELYRALEQLKRKLEARGFFRLERKRPLPVHPLRTAVITAPTGAAIRDFLRLAEERGHGAQIRLYPAPVQGNDAPPLLVRALKQADADGWAEVIVIIRGGGSLQDLWAFNDERLAEAVFASRTPILAGIGHEVDTSLADMTADVRAATPSHAAQLLWRERRWYAQRTDEAELALHRAARTRLAVLDVRLDELMRRSARHAPQRALARWEQRWEDLVRRLPAAQARRLEALQARLALLEGTVRRVGGLRRFAVAAERIYNLECRLHPVADRAGIRNETRLNDLCRRLDAAVRLHSDAARHKLDRLCWDLARLDPHAPLARGYAVAVAADGTVVRSVSRLTPGAAFTLRVADGSADAVVTEVRPDRERGTECG